MQYEERTRNVTSINIIKEYLREKKRKTTKTKNTQEKRENLISNRYSQTGKDQLRERNVNVVKTLTKDNEVEKQI